MTIDLSNNETGKHRVVLIGSFPSKFLDNLSYVALIEKDTVNAHADLYIADFSTDVLNTAETLRRLEHAKGAINLLCLTNREIFSKYHNQFKRIPKHGLLLWSSVDRLLQKAVVDTAIGKPFVDLGLADLF